MSHEHSRPVEEDVPRFDPWLGVLLSCLVPAGIGIALPSLFVPCTVTAAILFVVSMVMLKMQSRRRDPEGA